MSRQNLRPRIELDECDLLLPVVQNFPKRFVHEIELGGIEPERDRKLEGLGRAFFDQCFVDSPIFGKIGTVTVNRLLKIADHAEVARAGSIGFGLEQKRKLSRIGVLGFVENDTKRFLPNFAPDLGMFR